MVYSGDLKSPVLRTYRFESDHWYQLFQEIVMAGTTKQKKQQELSWKLKVIMGCRQNIYPRERDLPKDVVNNLMSICTELKEIETILRRELTNIK